MVEELYGFGPYFFCDGSVSSAIASHARYKTIHVLKIVFFLQKNRVVPFFMQ